MQHRTLMQPISKEKLMELGIYNIVPQYKYWIKRLVLVIMWMYATTWFPDDFNNTEMFSITTLFIFVLLGVSAVNLFVSYIAAKAIQHGMEILFVKSSDGGIVINKDLVRSYIGWPTNVTMLLTYGLTMLVMGVVSFRFFNDGNFVMSFSVASFLFTSMMKDFVS